MAMRLKWALKAHFFLLALALYTWSSAAQAQTTIVGVNLINPYALSKDAQDGILDAMRHAGVSVIRVSLTLDDKGVEFAERAQKHGLRIEWLIYHFGGYDPFGKIPLSAADPEKFRATFQPILTQLEDKGIVLAAFELGNEINLSGTNPEFTAHSGRARQLGRLDLENDPEGQKIAKGFVKYLKVLAVLKDLRDHSRLNQHTPIMPAGLGTYDQDDGLLPSWVKGDTVGVNTTLNFMRQHGLDGLVDAYAVHIYPDTRRRDSAGATLRKALIAKYDLAECAAQARPGAKTCWITEWGIDNGDPSCPINDDARAQMVREIMSDFHPYARDGRVSGVLYFAWNTTPGARTPMASSIWRCNGLTTAGKLTIDANLLK